MNKLAIKTLLTGLALIALAPLAFAEFIVPTAPGGYVLDEASVLSEATEAQLQTQLAALQTANSTQIVVVTLTDLQGYEPEQAALKIGRGWGVGQEGLDNGVVFLIVPTERVARIEVGYGLEGAITDAQSYQILNEVALPAFAEGNYDQGTVDAITALETLARGEPFTMPAQQNTTESLGDFLPYALILLWVLLSWFSQSKSWWLGGVFGGALGTLAALLTSTGLVLGLFIGIGAGLGLDYLVSKYFFGKMGGPGGPGGIFFGGGHGGSGGGGFGGFGGGSFGGGGASGRW